MYRYKPFLVYKVDWQAEEEWDSKAGRQVDIGNKAVALDMQGREQVHSYWSSYHTGSNTDRRVHIRVIRQVIPAVKQLH